MREYLNQRLNGRFWFILIAATLVTAIVGPFGTYSELMLWERVIYWGVLCFGIGSLMVLCIAYVLRAPTQRLSGYVPRIGIGACIAAIPGCALVFVMYQLMREAPLELTPSRLIVLWAEVSFMGVLVATIEVVRGGPLDPDPDSAATAQGKAGQSAIKSEPPLTELHSKLALPDANRAEIISLSMQDHYVEVSTTRGKDLILMRLSDAVDMLGGLDGLQIHRSHWVAKSHLRSLRKSGHRAWVKVSDGRELPVSRTYRYDVEAAVLLRRDVNAL